MLGLSAEPHVVPAQHCTHQMQRQGQHEQEEPQIKVAGVVEFTLLGVVVPSAGQGSPHPLPERLEHLGAHPLQGKD